MRWLLVGVAVLLAGCGVPVASTPVPLPVAELADPASIEIPRIGARSSLVPTGVDAAGGWEVPPLGKPLQASWFEPGPEPGESGTSVILGHVNGSGKPGIFARLTELRPGDDVLIWDMAGAVRVWRVAMVTRTPKTGFISSAGLRTDGPPAIVLVTCGGELVRGATGGRYLDNVIVAAVPL